MALSIDELNNWYSDNLSDFDVEQSEMIERMIEELKSFKQPKEVKSSYKYKEGKRNFITITKDYVKLMKQPSNTNMTLDIKKNTISNVGLVKGSLHEYLKTKMICNIPFHQIRVYNNDGKPVIGWIRGSEGKCIDPEKINETIINNNENGKVSFMQSNIYLRKIPQFVSSTNNLCKMPMSDKPVEYICTEWIDKTNTNYMVNWFKIKVTDPLDISREYHGWINELECIPIKYPKNKNEIGVT